MSVSIKVAIRCRPFTIDDKLGVKMRQISEGSGDGEIINNMSSASCILSPCGDTHKAY
jgi:hypothetical protein